MPLNNNSGPAEPEERPRQKPKRSSSAPPDPRSLCHRSASPPGRQQREYNEQYRSNISVPRCGLELSFSLPLGPRRALPAARRRVMDLRLTQTQPLQPVRLLELPPELLDQLESDHPPQCVSCSGSSVSLGSSMPSRLWLLLVLTLTLLVCA